jgi:hypothetical protein
MTTSHGELGSMDVGEDTGGRHGAYAGWDAFIPWGSAFFTIIVAEARRIAKRHPRLSRFNRTVGLLRL